MNCKQELLIDAVITWVDGQDLAHQEKLNDYLATLGAIRPQTANPTRFHNAGEIDYCIVSLLRFAPWLRHIYIVTDAQVPSIVQKIRGSQFESKIKIVDHREIFLGYESVLPTFNIRSIMTMLWRIPGLSENFIFLNDDFAVLRPLNPADFFREGKVVLRGEWHKMSSELFISKIRLFWRKLFPVSKERQALGRAKHLVAQEFSARIAGFTHKYFRLAHNPHPWRISSVQRFFSIHPEYMTENIQYKLRSSNQFISECLAAYLEIKSDSAIIDNRLKTLQLKPATQALSRVRRSLRKADVDENIAFICIQSIEKADEQTQKLVFDWLDKRIGNIDSLVD